jgi:hypothetical protein
MRLGIRAFLPLLLIMSFITWPQEQPVNTGEPLSFVGMRLAELVERFGPPETVSTARGGEVWQDDIVFQYAEGDFYIFRDRVWQVKLASAFGVSLRDSKAVALLVLGKEVQGLGDHLLLPLPAGGWPLALRVNFSNAGLVSAIYIYRPDF